MEKQRHCRFQPGWTGPVHCLIDSGGRSTYRHARPETGLCRCWPCGRCPERYEEPTVIAPCEGSALQVSLIRTWWLYVLLALGCWACVGPALGATLRVQVKVTAGFSGIPREEIRAAEVTAAPAEEVGLATSLKDFDYASCLAGALVERFEEAAGSSRLPSWSRTPREMSGRGQCSWWKCRSGGSATARPIGRREASERGSWSTWFATRCPLRKVERPSVSCSCPARSGFCGELPGDDEAFLVSELRKSIQAYAGLLVNKVLYPESK